MLNKTDLEKQNIPTGMLLLSWIMILTFSLFYLMTVWNVILLNLQL